MSAALGLKVRTVVSLHLWDLFRGPAPWASPAARESAAPAAARPTAERGTAGMLMRMDVCQGYRAAPKTAKGAQDEGKYLTALCQPRRRIRPRNGLSGCAGRSGPACPGRYWRAGWPRAR